MNTILVPTDFSDESMNAAIYSVGFAKQVNAKKIILYHAYTMPVNFSVVSAEPVLINQELMDIEDLNSSATVGLAHFEAKLKKLTNTDVALETIANYGFFVEDIKKTEKEKNVDLIIMSITGGGAFTESIIGSNSLVVGKNTAVPVIIVPAKASFKGLDKLLLVSDFVDIKESIPTGHIKNILDKTKSDLNILHVAKTGDYTFNPSSEECFVFEDLFEGYSPKFHFTENYVFADGINEFSDNNNMDLVVIVPKKHHFLESLFTKSHTKELAFHSHFPIMVVHD